jgi:hypothetical protein
MNSTRNIKYSTKEFSKNTVRRSSVKKYRNSKMENQYSTKEFSKNYPYKYEGSVRTKEFSKNYRYNKNKFSKTH